MKKKIFLIVIAFLICCVGGYFAFTYFQHNKEEETPVQTDISSVETTEKPEESSTEDLGVTWNDYEVYQSDLFDFDFVIANITIKSDEAINISLDHFVTSEGITLSDYQQYVDVLESNSYYLGKKNVWFSLISTTDTFTGNIFIPFTDKQSDSINVTYDFDDKGTQSFDLNQNQESINDLLYYETQETISDGNSYEMQVSDSFELSNEEMMENGETMILPSSARVFALKVKAVSLWGDEVVIDDAVFVSSDGSETHAEDSSVSSMKYQNMIQTTIQEQDEGCLFFIMLDPDHSISNEEGILRLTVNGSDTPIEINVSIGG